MARWLRRLLTLVFLYTAMSDVSLLCIARLSGTPTSGTMYVADTEDDEYVDDEELGHELVNEEEGESDDNAASVVEEEDALEVEPLVGTYAIVDDKDEEPINHVAPAPPEAPPAQRFRCTCPRYFYAGICYHVVMYTAMIMNRNLDEEVAQLPAVRRAGRKRNTAPALERQR
eukprot:GHVU01052628.1.p1 GENE.GHVU01052628.1~~GHVU01052628.1.p1  ORF type:complete len:172 (+),score=23.19 GHVU01052628.1:207-722(+)